MEYTQSSEAAKERARIAHGLLTEGKSLAAVGKLFGVSRERVRQLVKKHFPEYKAPRGRPKK